MTSFLNLIAWLTENWLIVFIALVLIAVAVVLLVKFFKLSPAQQFMKIRLALLSLVIEAEKELKRKTGEAKRSRVYNWLKEKFPIITLFLSEAKFDELLDSAIKLMIELLTTSDELYKYVYGKARTKTETERLLTQIGANISDEPIVLNEDVPITEHKEE